MHIERPLSPRAPANRKGIRIMCRNIKPLFNYDPAVTEGEVRASALQYVRKVSGFTRPSKANEAAFERAVEEIARSTRTLIDSLETSAPPRDREREVARLKSRSAQRYAGGGTEAGGSASPRA